MAVTRIKNNQITDSTITGAKIVNATLTGGLFATSLTLNSEVSIVGNLSVTGATSTVSSTNTFINDPLVVYNNGYTGSLSNYSIGMLVNRNLASLAALGSVNVAWAWSEAEGAFVAIATTDTGSGITNINNSGYANVKVGYQEVTGKVTAAELDVTLADITNLMSTTLVATNFSSSNVDINGGAIDGTAIGATSASTGVFSTIDASGITATTGNAATWYATTLNSTAGNITTLTAPTINAGTTTSATVNATTGNITTATAGSLAVSDLTNNRVVIAGTSGELEDDANFTFDGSSLLLTGLLRVTGNVTADNISIDGQNIGTPGGGDLTIQAGGGADNVIIKNSQLIEGAHAVTLDAVTLNSTAGNITTLTSPTIDAQTTTSTTVNATTGNITTLTSPTIDGQTTTTTTLNATTGNITTLSAGTIHISELTVPTLNSTAGNITTLGAPNFSSANLQATGGFVDNIHVGANTAATGNFTTLEALSLDVDNITINGNDITSTDTDGDINVTPNGTGSVVLDGLSYPQADGSANQVIRTDGSGQLSFATVLTDIVADTTPQLGGSLDVNGQSIVSVSNGDINITPNGTGDVVVSTLEVSDLTDNRVVIAGTAGAIEDDANLTYDGTNLTTNGLVATTADINGGTVDGTTIGGASAAAGTFTDLSATNAALTGGYVDNVHVGANTAATGTFTSLVATTADINGGTVDGTNIGVSSQGSGAFTTLSASGTSTVAQVDATVLNGATLNATAGNVTTLTAPTIDGQTTTTTTLNATTGNVTTLTATNVINTTLVATNFSSSNVDINGGAVDGAAIGAASASTGAFTTLSASGNTTVTSSQSSGNASSGALVVTGGAGIGENLNVGGDVVITGDLTVEGDTTTINTATLNVEDLNITIADGAADAASANGAGITVDGANATLTYANADDSWNFNKLVKATTGSITTLTSTNVINTTLVATNFSSGNVQATGGFIDNVHVGANTAATGTFTSLDATTADIDGGTVDGTNIGATTPGTGAFTTLSATGTSTVAQVDATILNGATVNATAGNITTLTSPTIDAQTTTTTTVNATTGNITTATAGSLAVSDLTDNRVVIAGASGELEDDANFTFDGTDLNLTGGLNVTGDLAVDNIAVNGNDVTSTDTNGDINITPNGTGSVVLDGLSHPQADGSAGQALITDGSAQLSFATVLTDVVQDTTPQLGGSLDVNGQSIVSVSNGDINITPNGTGDVVVSTIEVSDLTNNRVVIAGTAGALEDDSNLTYDGTNLTTNGLVATTADINGGTVDGTAIGSASASTGAFTTLSASGTSTVAQVDATILNSASLNTTAGNITTLTSPTIDAQTTTTTTLNATAGNITTLTSPTVDAQTTTSTTVNATTGNVTTLTATNVINTTLVATNFSSSNVDVNGGAIDGTPVGAASASTGAFTTLSASGTSTVAQVDATILNGATVNATAGNITTLTSPTVDAQTTTSTTLNATTGNITTLTAPTIHAQTTTSTTVNSTSGNITTLTGTTVNAQTTTSTGVNATNGNVTTLVATNFSSGNVDVNGGAIDGTNIGAASAGTGAFTTLGASGISTLAGRIDATAGTASTSDATGALVITGTGGAGIGGNINVGGGALLNTDQTANYDVKVYGANDTSLLWARSASGYDQVLVGNSAAVSDLVTGAKLQINTTDSILLPSGTTAQRPGSVGGTDTAGMIRFNTSIADLEFYDGSSWTTAGSEFTVLASDTFDGDDSATAFTLGAAATTAGVIASINGVVQLPTTAYSVSGTTLTFTEAPATGDKIEVRRIITTSTVASLESPNGYVQFEAADAGAKIYAGSSAATLRWTIDTNGHLVPAANSTQNIGSSSARLGTLYVTDLVTGNQGDLRFNDADSSNFVAFQAPATVGSNITWTLPAEDASVSGYALVSDASGTLSWAAAGATIAQDEATNTNFNLYFASATSGALTSVKYDSGVHYNPSTGTLTSSVVDATTLKIGGTSVSSTATELNVLDGIPGTLTATELGYVDGVTSAIQTQLDAKAPLASPALTGTATAVNLTVSGDLTVNGTTTTISTTNLTVEDNLIELNSGATSNASDLGLLMERGSTGDNVFMGWDESADRIKFATTTATATATGDLTLTSANIEANYAHVTSTQSLYADLAENYQADATYAAGTVLEFGGAEEVTTATEDSRRVAGIVSTDPAHLMNGGLTGSNVVPLALMGRVPCLAIGPVAKGDMMVSAGHGYAKADANPATGTVIGKALETLEDGVKATIEVVVGKV